MKTKNEVNYRVQNDLIENRSINCERCRNFFAVNPYKNRCMLMDTDLKNRKMAIQLDAVCDLFNGFNQTHNANCKCQSCTNYYNALEQTVPLQ